MDAERYPLSWPTGWKRTPASSRRRAQFSRASTEYYTRGDGSRGSVTSKKALSVADAITRLAGELRRLGVQDGDWLISSNVRTRLDGLPYSNDKPPQDVGVAVYFRLARKDRCLACDTWDRVADNIAAVAQHIDALRRIDRYGVGTLDQAFAGYTALNAAPVDWWLVLGVLRTATLADVEAAWLERVKAVHPDRLPADQREHGQAETAKLNAARDRARAELGGR